MKNYIIFDGDCYFCKNYIKYKKVMNAIPNLELVNARLSIPDEILHKVKNLDLNKGMVVVFEGNVYYSNGAYIKIIELVKNKNYGKIARLYFSMKYFILKQFRVFYLLISSKNKIN